MLQKKFAGGKVDLQPDHILGLQLTYLLDALLRRHEHGHNEDDGSKQRYESLLQMLIAHKELGAS
jgi:hypothetical protein